jgi:DNA-directed RNA polymerase specialized sigma24 family protein
MHIPSGHTEEGLLASIDKIVSFLAPSFVFGFYGKDDIKQQATLFAIEALPRYNHTNTVDNFLFISVKNRLINFRRDNYHCDGSPCRECNSTGSYHANGHKCKKYLAWEKRMKGRKNVAFPDKMDDIDTCDRHDFVEEICYNELVEQANEKVPPNLRKYFVMMLNDVPVPKRYREQIQQHLFPNFANASPENS